MAYGYMGSILRVNLTEKEISVEKPDEVFYRRYFGGRGLISYFLLKELPEGTSPLSPENMLIFSCGPVTGAPITGSGRNSVGARSPLTGAYGEAEVGGFWGAEIKKAGFDAVIVEGEAVDPVYLWIHNGKAEIKDASHVWGMELKEAQQTLQKDLDDKSVKAALIGPGGENQVRFASVINDLNHVAGRCGLGAVMGSKKLKAVTVKGSSKVQIANSDRLQKLAQWMASNVDQVAHNLHRYGTGSHMDYTNALVTCLSKTSEKALFLRWILSLPKQLRSRWEWEWGLVLPVSSDVKKR